MGLPGRGESLATFREPIGDGTPPDDWKIIALPRLHSAVDDEQIIQALPFEGTGLELREGAALGNEIKRFRHQQLPGTNEGPGANLFRGHGMRAFDVDVFEFRTRANIQDFDRLAGFEQSFEFQRTNCFHSGLLLNKANARRGRQLPFHWLLLVGSCQRFSPRRDQAEATYPSRDRRTAAFSR
jgi:hypothetical protein